MPLFPKIPNTDWLNVRPNPDFKHNAILLTFLLFVGGIIAMVILSDVNRLLATIVGFSMMFLGGYILYKEEKKNSKLGNNGHWSFDYPIQATRHHDFKVGDEVEITLGVVKK